MTARPKNDTADNTEVEIIPKWEFDKPKAITCAIAKIRTATLPVGADGEPYSYPLLWVTEVETGQDYLIHAFPSVLISELRAVKPEIGDVITIAYQGQKITNSKRKAHVFEVTAGAGVAQEYDWDNAPF